MTTENKFKLDSAPRLGVWDARVEAAVKALEDALYLEDDDGDPVALDKIESRLLWDARILCMQARISRKAPWMRGEVDRSEPLGMMHATAELYLVNDLISGARYVPGFVFDVCLGGAKPSPESLAARFRADWLRSWLVAQKAAVAP